MAPGRTTRRCAAAALAAVAAMFAVSAPAQADRLLAPAVGAKHLAAAGGWYAWATPRADGRWRLTTLHDGIVATPAIPSFGAAPDASIGSTGYAVDTKRIVAVYSRCRGNSALVGCDLYELDLVAGTERKLTKLSSRAASETAPSLSVGRVAFARRDGASPGTYTATLAGSSIRRLDGRIARETAVSISRVSYLVKTRRDGRDELTMSQLDGRNDRLVRRATYRTLFSPVITRYRVGWLEHTGDGPVLARMTDRINASTTTITARDGRHLLPEHTTSAATDESRIATWLDADGVHLADPLLFP